MIMTENDWYWLAGLLEGEGSFLAPPPSMPNTVRIALQMTDKPVVEKVGMWFKNFYLAEIDRKPGEWTTSYRLTLVGAKAASIMATVYPLMGQRRQSQITRALNSITKQADPYLELQMQENDHESTFFWLVGYLEGEASFMKAPPSRPNKPRIQVWTTDEDIIARLSSMWKIKYKSYQRNEDVKEAFLILLRAKRAVDLMQKLRPHMSERRQEQIDEAIASFDFDRFRQKYIDSSPLNPDQVREIRRLLAQGVKKSAIAVQFGVLSHVIVDINRGKTWQWLED